MESHGFCHQRKRSNYSRLVEKISEGRGGLLVCKLLDKKLKFWYPVGVDRFLRSEKKDATDFLNRYKGWKNVVKKHNEARHRLNPSQAFFWVI